MSTRMSEAMSGLWPRLRHEPTEKRIRATLGEHVVVDSTRALLVWEPRRISPTYAFPVEEVQAELTTVGPVEPGGPGFLHPGIPFRVHSTEGEALTVSVSGHTREQAAFRPADPDLAGFVLLDFDAMDQWFEEDEQVRAHPRDPYHRVDFRASSRHVRIAHQGQVLADTTRPVLVFETHLPTRFYLPREDVVADLRPSTTVTYCPYKGEASYWSIEGRSDIAWTYRQPLPDVAGIAGLVAFYDDVLEVTVDGVDRKPADTVAAKAVLEEFNV